MIRHPIDLIGAIAAFGLVSFASAPLRADVITEWDIVVCQITAHAQIGTPPANRLMAIAQTAVYEAANAITHRYPDGSTHLSAAPGASLDAAVAAANHVSLTRLLPMQRAAIDAAYQAALAKIADGPARANGVVVGESAARAVLTARADDGAATPERYRPYATAGVYVPTAIPIASQWPQRKPWLMSSPEHFRPGPPPALTSETWTRDYNEVRNLGAKNSTARTPAQTAMARFWETTGPQIYHGVIRSVANAPGRDVMRNARLFAAVAQASDDAVIAVFDAKYRYNFWRPITAIRNGDADGNNDTEREADWAPFIDTPMHPEYACAHCIVAATVGTVLAAEVGVEPMPLLTTRSPTADGAARTWLNIEDFIAEVSNARIYDGVHYRNSAEVGTVMGRRIGQLAAAHWFSRTGD